MRVANEKIVVKLTPQHVLWSVSMNLINMFLVVFFIASCGDSPRIHEEEQGSRKQAKPGAENTKKDKESDLDKEIKEEEEKTRKQKKEYKKAQAAIEKAKEAEKKKAQKKIQESLDKIKDEAQNQKLISDIEKLRDTLEQLEAGKRQEACNEYQNKIFKKDLVGLVKNYCENGVFPTNAELKNLSKGELLDAFGALGVIASYSKLL